MEKIYKIEICRTQKRTHFSFELVLTLENRNFAYFLTLYFLPSPERLNYDSPSQLARSLAVSELTLITHSIGHVIVALEKKCGDECLERNLAAVTTQGNSEERKLLLKDQIAFGILFQTLAGRKETQLEIEQELRVRSRSGKMKFLKMEVSADAYERMNRYSREYHERGFEKFFGMTNRPRYGEGAGCSAYALSYLEVAGLILPQFTKAWTRTLLVPQTLVGGALTQKKVSFFKLLFAGSKFRWALPHEPHFTVTFWDPDLMFDWVHNMISEKNTAAHFEFCKQQAAQGVSVDCREMEVPTGSLWRFEPLRPQSPAPYETDDYESNFVRKSG